MKAGSLAELPVVGLQRLGGGLVLDDCLDAPADLLHIEEVGALARLHAFRAAQARAADGANDAGPSVVDQVHVLRAAVHEDVEVVAPGPLPPALQAARPGRVGGAV